MGDRRKRPTTVNLAEEQLERIEAWRARRAIGGQMPSFAAAVREIVDVGLGVTDPRGLHHEGG